MNAGAADGGDIIERPLERSVEVALAAGQRGEAEFRTLRRVDGKLCEIVLLELRRHRRRRGAIGKLEFDRGETRSRGGAKGFDQRAFGEQMAEIGGKAGHGAPWRFLLAFCCFSREA